MKAIASNLTKPLEIGSKIQCADNSGGKILKIIGVKARAGTSQRRVKAGVADKVNVRIIKGNQELKGEVHEAVIIRQKKEYQRPEGLRVKFKDNAGVILEESGIPKGNKIKGPVAKEVVERYTEVGKVASMVV